MDCGFENRLQSNVTEPFTFVYPADSVTTHPTQPLDDTTMAYGAKASQNLRRSNLVCIASLVVLAMISVTVIAYQRGQIAAIDQRVASRAVAPVATIDGLTFPMTQANGRWVLPVDAEGAVSGENFSMAAGALGGGTEGLFVLDHNSGLLQCQVMYPRTGAVGATFQANVAEALGTGGKGGKYMMVIGRVDFPRSSQRPVASCIAYVMDAATGNFVGFGIPFNAAMVAGNRPQSGAMVQVVNGSANPLIDRDAIR